MSEEKLREFQSVFYPQSIAVVGVSQDGSKASSLFFGNLVKVGFKGRLYAVNPKGGEILGFKIYPNLESIGEPVDYALISVASSAIPSAIQDCVAKGVKVMHLFTAGFSETGTEEGKRLEDEIVSKVRHTGVRLIGPNCIGVYSPRSCMPLRPWDTFIGEIGCVGFISQSGGQAINLVVEGRNRGIGFSKGVNYGNGVDLNESDFLEYLAVDSETGVIAAYIEGVKDGQRLLRVLREATKTKPVVVWKAGRTESGARAAASHSGSLAGSEAIWAVALRQSGTVRAENFEELIDTLIAFQNLPPLRQIRLAVIGGLYDGAGGFSVAATDACADLGLSVPQFSAETRGKLEAIIPSAGTIRQNPIDTGGASITDLKVLQQIFKLVVADDETNLVLLNEPMEVILAHIPKETAEALHDTIIELSSKKPFVIISTPGSAETERLLVEKFVQAKLPVYSTVERAAKAITNFTQYWQFRHSLDKG